MENIPEGKGVMASNHVSKADGPLIITQFRNPVRYLSKEELFQTLRGKIFYEGVGQIPIRRGKSDSYAFEYALRELDKGNKVGVFPEGTRGDGKTFLKPHTGVIRLALLSDSPIIPVGVSGSVHAFPKGSILPTITKVKIKFGKPWIVPKPPAGREYTYEELQDLSQYLMDEKISPLIDWSMSE